MTTALPFALGGALTAPSSLPAPWEDPLAWDQIEIAGRLWPGIVKVTGAEQIYKWQINEAKGADGATTAYQGGDIAKPKLTFVLWKGLDDRGGFVDYFAMWEAFQPILEASIPPPGSKKDPIALSIHHPAFRKARIGSCSVEKIGQVLPDGNGGATVDVDLLVFRPPKKAGGTVKGATNHAPGDRPKTEVEQAADNEAGMTTLLLASANAPGAP